jgi:hypothetical protein
VKSFARVPKLLISPSARLLLYCASVTNISDEIQPLVAISPTSIVVEVLPGFLLNLNSPPDKVFNSLIVTLVVKVPLVS